MVTKKTVKDELKILSPEEILTLSTGEELKISPFKFVNFPVVIKIISEYASSFSGELEILDIANTLVSDGGQGVFTLIRLSTGINQSQLEELSADDGIALLAKVIEVNFDFFTQKILPKINNLGDKLSKKAGDTTSAS